MAIEHRIIVAKRLRQLSLLSGPEVLRIYPIALGRNSAADKSVEGDEATPLGDFYVCAKNPHGDRHTGGHRSVNAMVLSG
jgi:murein L,D-transpeptidase YafK